MLEGYGLTEATCLVAVNPPYGERQIGSVGLPFAYTDVRILHCAADGMVTKECATDEVGEICVRNPGVHADVYTDPAATAGCSPRATCAPAISAASTPTATSGSPGAPRT